MLWPTAVHVDAAQDTAERTPPPVGFADGSINQTVPIRCSTSVTFAPAAFTAYPTAVQLVAVVHETAESALVVAPAGFGVVWIDQAVPFHASARVTSTPEPLTYSPTAMQAVAAVHETPESALLVAPEGAGVG